MPHAVAAAPVARSAVVVGRSDGRTVALTVAADGSRTRRDEVADLSSYVGDRERAAPVRWVWSDTAAWYPALLSAGVRVARCHDLRLAHAVLRHAAAVPAAVRDELAANSTWERGGAATASAAPALFEVQESAGVPDDIDEAAAEYARHCAATANAADPARLRLLLAAESAGALVAAELQAAGLPWDAASHDALLTEVLGARDPGGGPPARLAAAAARVRAALADPTLSVDSQPKLLRALHRAGVLATSTSRWELARHDHPAIAPLLEYKRLSRLYAANGWTWLTEWVHDGRFRPVYVPSGVVTGRWASSGGGALQVPRMLRAAVRADPGWTLVVADVAQLEPRVLAGMSRDRRLADAARGRDLYTGVVETGAVATRAEAKVAMLGAMYGATTGESGRLLPRLRRAFPDAMAFVDAAARVGEAGGVVTTWLGRSSPPPGVGWNTGQADAGDAEASATDEARARRVAGDRGRFTRNFVVQGTAAEWAAAWLAELRGRLHGIAPDAGPPAAASGAVFAHRPHLAFFLHDEIIVHTPLGRADEVAAAVREAAVSAGRLLFGGFPVDFPLDLRISATAEKA